MKINDEIILNLLKEGNRDSYAYLFKKYYEPLKIQARYILKDEMEAEDIVQDLFLEIMDKQLTVNIKSSLKGYLSTCVYHKCIHFINRNKSKQVKIDQFILASSYSVTETPFARQDNLRSMNLLLGNLSGQREKICKLIYWENRKYKEVASEMGITINSIKTHLRLANKSLKKQCDNSRANMLRLLYA